MKLSNREAEQVQELRAFNEDDGWFFSLSLHAILYYLAEETDWETIKYIADSYLKGETK